MAITITGPVVFAWFMLCLVLKRGILLIFIVTDRVKDPATLTTPEDKSFAANTFAKAANNNNNYQPAPAATAATTAIEQWSRGIRSNKIITNDSENDTYYLIQLLATTLWTDSVNRVIIYSALYLFCRLLHTICYINGIQPYRSLSFTMGILLLNAISLDLVITLSQKSA